MLLHKRCLIGEISTCTPLDNHRLDAVILIDNGISVRRVDAEAYDDARGVVTARDLQQPWWSWGCLRNWQVAHLLRRSFVGESARSTMDAVCLTWNVLTHVDGTLLALNRTCTCCKHTSTTLLAYFSAGTLLFLAWAAQLATVCSINVRVLASLTKSALVWQTLFSKFSHHTQRTCFHFCY